MIILWIRVEYKCVFCKRLWGSYNQLSINPNITWEIVRDNPDKKWNFSVLSSNPNITWEIVRDNPDKPWSYYMLSMNPNITWDIIKDNPDKPWSYYYISQLYIIRFLEACLFCVSFFNYKWFIRAFCTFKLS